MNAFAKWTAILAIGTAGIVGCNKEDNSVSDTRTPGEKAGDAVRKGVDATTQKSSDVATDAKKSADDAAAKVNASIAPTGVNDVSGVRKAVDGAVSNALDKNNWNDMAGYFTAVDKGRVSGDAKPDLATYNTTVDKFRELWKSKYGAAFSSMNADEIYNTQMVSIMGGPGVVGDVKNSNATATIAAGHEMLEVRIPLVAESGKWRIDIPDDVSNQQLHDNLNKAISDLSANSAKWPDDKNEAYRLIAHRILMAVMNVKG